MTDRNAADGPTGDDLAWETLDASTAYSCDGFDVVNQSVRLPDGTESEFDYLSESEAVVVLPFTPDGDVVVIDEWRQAVDRVNRGLPAGSIEPEDDDPVAAAHRELVEETGHEASVVDHLTSVEPANGFADSYFHYFVAHGCEPTAEQRLDHNESIRVETTTFDELVEDVRTGDLQDGRSAFAVLHYALFEDGSSQR
ncbi:ADP-ribose pyrophosphatase [Halomicrobium zhouii]|uniref:ADP-ribose pyrophosphatase n=1 Tax=Halomicrobium zhouii TaxID=767519 RepID=A0A1I6KGF2_9EURY|nr:NUDIX hydrolase [Halomicrobium zhouii]SFR90321.1 ADP-ribose pyrophosphatase [Halomicrobium zhouii]